MKLVLLLAICLTNRVLSSPLPAAEDDKGCSEVCPSIFAQVCGSDGKTYDSKCLLEAQNCKKGLDVTVVDEGECQKQSGDSKDNGNRGNRHAEDSPKPAAQEEKKCNGKCNRDFKPVCASNGSTFNNACLLEFEACKAGPGENITKISEGPCPAVAEGKSDADAEKDKKDEEKAEEKDQKPEAKQASEDKSEESPKAETKDSDNKAKEDKEESNTEVPEKKDHANNKCSNIRCSRELNPVCGSNGKTYNSECFLRYQTCLEDIKVDKARDGRCEDPVTPQPESKGDSKDDGPAVIIIE